MHDSQKTMTAISRRRLLALAAGSVVAGLAGCGGDDDGTSTQADTSTSTATSTATATSTSTSTTTPTSTATETPTPTSTTTSTSTATPTPTPEPGDDPGGSWDDGEYGFEDRVAELIGSQSWEIGNGNQGPDAGKRTWPPLLAEMWKDRDDPDAIQEWIETEGASLIESQYAGSFFKPFSVPGYTDYYHTYEDRLPDSQIESTETMLESEGWDQLTREDHHMDPIWEFTEFNSENFNWMARLGGYLWAHEFGDDDRIAYFESYVDNWIRALFNAGRVEWNSNNYWGYCAQPILVLYQHASDSKTRAQARAGLDWMVTEAALHYLDGFQVGPDVRAKSGAYRAFAGSTWPYTYLYFATEGNEPSYTLSSAKAEMSQNLVGFAPGSSYRPPPVLVALANRDHETPVEIRSAKPFYELDFDNYADWAGDTERSRRFEFETLYRGADYTLGSVATYRPDGNAAMDTQGQTPFIEQSVWRFGVRSDSEGATQVFGNAGSFDHLNGRCPYEEIAQSENVMMRLLKGADRMWTAVPESTTIQVEGSTAFVDVGQDVYLALTPHAETGFETGTFEHDEDYRRLEWTYADAGVGALVTEVGTGGTHGSFSAFRDAITSDATIGPDGTDSVRYEAASGGTLTGEFQPLTTYEMNDGTMIEDAGVVPKAWIDGERVEYGTWDSYEVTTGPEIVSQEWGSGQLTVRAGGESLTISIDDDDASVSRR